MFADDLLLLSLSQTGLQEAVNRLHTYCTEWGMEVNVAKTKAMKIRRPHVTNREWQGNQYPFEVVLAVQDKYGKRGLP